MECLLSCAIVIFCSRCYPVFGIMVFVSRMCAVLCIISYKILCYIIMMHQNINHHVSCAVLFYGQVSYQPVPPLMTSHYKPSKMLHTCASGTYSAYSTCSTYVSYHATHHLASHLIQIFQAILIIVAFY